jgi:integrase
MLAFCRLASLMIAAGVNAKALSAYMGHASVMITLDRYGHLMPWNEGRPSRSWPRPRTRMVE